MDEARKIRKVIKPVGPLAGFKGKVLQISYGHAIKVGMPSRERYDPNHALDVNLHLVLELSEEDDWRQIEQELIDHVHAKLEKTSEERVEFWKKELGID